MEIARAVYQLTSSFPSEELYGLVSQMRRSSVSIASNIAEGSGRGSPKDFARFLNIARGSLAELQTQLLLSESLGFYPQAGPVFEDLEELSKMLRGLQRSLDSQLSTLD
jgi:four helix bundle protein